MNILIIDDSLKVKQSFLNAITVFHHMLFVVTPTRMHVFTNQLERQGPGWLPQVRPSEFVKLLNVLGNEADIIFLGNTRNMTGEHYLNLWRKKRSDFFLSKIIDISDNQEWYLNEQIEGSLETILERIKSEGD